MFIIHGFALQGLCIPPEVEELDREGATEFVDAEGGGFDEGQGTKNVSSEVEPSDLVSICIPAYVYTTTYVRQYTNRYVYVCS